MSRVAVVSLIGILFFCAIAPGIASTLPASFLARAPPAVGPTAGSFVGWRDNFDDVSRVGASSNVAFSGSDVRVPPGGVATLTRQGLVLGRGPPGDFDAGELGDPTVVFDQGIYHMWYFGSPGAGMWSIGYATSADGQVWTKQGRVLSSSIPADSASAAYPEVIKVGSEYWMWYSGSDGSRYQILLATSSDGLVWTKRGVVVGVGPPGSPDDQHTYAPSVLIRSGTFYMWYGAFGSPNPGRRSVLLASSTDGVSWTKQGVVLTPGPSGSIDEVGVDTPSVRVVGGQYEMLYGAVDSAIRARLARAVSPDGRSWQKMGIILDLMSPYESTVLDNPFLLPESDGSWKVYYHARGASLQIFLAIRPLPGGPSGWLRSIPITIPAGLEWSWFNQSASVPAGTWLNVTVRDAMTMAILAGMENRTVGAVDLTGVDSSIHPGIVLEGWLTRDPSDTPVLDSWEVIWLDRSPPTFAGLETADDLRTGGSIRLSWSAASDPSAPILYSVYQSSGSDAFDFSTPSYTATTTAYDVTALVDGRLYRFVVRAEDAWANQDTNTVSLSAIPTNPFDRNAPTFAGLTSAADERTGGAVRLAWSDAVDPDTPASNADPSLPITYLVYVTRSGTSFDFGGPDQTTSNRTAWVTGLVDGKSYDFIVRAMDSRGNAESNTVIRSATPTHPFDSTPPIFSGVDGVRDLGMGDKISVEWLAASDPDTPESNTDPSLPIVYSIYVSDRASGLGSGPANGSTSETSLEIGGLRPGRTYYILVRATDAAGNTEMNTRIVSIQIKEAVSVAPFAWIALILVIVIAVLAAGVVMRKRRKKGETPPLSPPPAR